MVTFARLPFRLRGYMANELFIKHVTDQQAFEAYIYAVAKYTTAEIQYADYVERADIEIAEKAGSSYKGQHYHAIIKMRDQITGFLHSTLIVAPIDAMLEESTRGMKVKQADGEEITKQYALMGGFPKLVFEEGFLVG